MLKIALESLGCSKNLVDAEIMMGILNEKGYKLTGNFEEADVILVNTCGFIESAKQESIQTILEFAELKETANLKLLIVTGCLAQRYADELKEEIPEIDAIVGTGSYQNIDEILAELSEKHQIVSLNNIEFAYDENLPRYVSTPSHMAYLKIGEGCDNKCTYCIIPKLRGKYRSRKMEDIIAEAKKLAERGVKELVVIAQDTTKYGLDLYGEEKLANLLEELAQIEGFKWIRVMYSYPESITEPRYLYLNTTSKVPLSLGVPLILKDLPSSCFSILSPCISSVRPDNVISVISSHGIDTIVLYGFLIDALGITIGSSFTLFSITTISFIRYSLYSTHSLLA